ncbi:hypothetical protein F652_2037 [Enterobacteriaceae bacterium bta3-1]|nr:hypothetical protein F652_2037 [Enterobacteriaceae bacterium bta3-1]
MLGKRPQGCGLPRRLDAALDKSVKDGISRRYTTTLHRYVYLFMV